MPAKRHSRTHVSTFTTAAPWLSTTAHALGLGVWYTESNQLEIREAGVRLRQPQHRLTRASSVACVSLGPSGSASPKSATLAVSVRSPVPLAHMRTPGKLPTLLEPLLVSMTLPALRSPWTMPSLCRCSMAAATSWASARTAEGARKPPGLASKPQSKASLNDPCARQHQRKAADHQRTRLKPT
jgi:hypothetical protein